MDFIKKTILHLSLIHNVGPVLIKHLIESMGFERIQDLYSFNEQDLKINSKLDAHQARLIYHGLKNIDVLNEELKACAYNDIKWTTFLHDDYPQSLKSLHAPPVILYWQGTNPAYAEKSLSFIGSRQANWYAKEVMQILIPPLVNHEFTIVSGGAIGADTLAHQQTLKSQGKTIAVLGSGLLKPYPKQNERLFKEIVENGGCIVSPFSVNTSPVPGNFPARNRIIAGLSAAVIIVQAAQKSGTLITAQFALEQGINIGVVPGLITDPLSAGCHDLIKQGAQIITSSNDIFAMLNLELDIESESSKKVGVSETNPLILACIQPKTLDELIIELKLSPIDLQEQLLCLQIEGKLSQDFLGRWQRNI